MPEDRKLPNFNRSPMLWLGLAFTAGILAASFRNVYIPLAVVACGLLSLVAFFFRRNEYATLFMLAAFAAAGAASIQVERQSVGPNRIKTLIETGAVASGSPVEVEGVIRGAPEPILDGKLITLSAETLSFHGTSQNVSGNVRLFLPQTDITELHLKHGSRIRVACRLARDEAFLNPGVMSRKALLDRQGIDATCSVKSALLVEHVADESVFLPLAWVYEQRAQLINDFRGNMQPKTAGVMIASLLGDKYFLDKDTADLFREGGTFHILVISGLHITFIGGLLLLFIRQLTRNRWTQFAITILILWAYTLAVGADVPVVRAATMFTILLYSYATHRPGQLLNSLGLCGLILLIWRPSDVLDASFQLTFVSVAAIVAMAYPLIDKLRMIGTWTPTVAEPFPPNVPGWLQRTCETLYWNPAAWTIESGRNVWSAKLFKSSTMPIYLTGSVLRFGRAVFEGIVVSLIVQLWMTPLLVVYFHRMSVASILLNLWVGYFIALESFAAVVGAIAGRVSDLLAAPFFAIAEIFNWLMLSVPRLFADHGWASFRLPAYSAFGMWIYVVYFIPVIFLAIVVSKWDPFEIRMRPAILEKRWLISSALLILVLFSVTVLHPFSAPSPDGRLHVDFLDVGQGDSALVTFPDGRTLLVDGGGRFRYETAGSGNEDAEPFEPDVRGIGESVVSEVLWQRGYSRIDHILVTHADVDHIQGLTDVARNFSIESALVARTPMSDPDFADLADVLHRRGVPIEVISRGDRLDFDEVKVEVLCPTATIDQNVVSDNDHSIVLRIIMGSRAFLLTGDIERIAESQLLNGGGPLTADLVKVPHHGSRTSSTQPFVDAVGAQYAVISVGRSSPFGHPHPDVVERWKAAGVKVVTTGERGMISVSTDGRDLEMKTFQP